MDGVRGRDFSEYKSEVKMSDLSCAKDEVFSRTFRVYYEDTDAGGRVYHANYLKFCERTRTDFVREVLGYRQSEHLQADQKGFVVTKLNAAFMAGAGLEDDLKITCIPVMVRRACLEMYQEVSDAHTGTMYFAMRSTIAYVNFATGKPEGIPKDFLDALKAQQGPEDLKTLC